MSENRIYSRRDDWAANFGPPLAPLRSSSLRVAVRVRLFRHRNERAALPRRLGPLLHPTAGYRRRDRRVSERHRLVVHLYRFEVLNRKC